MARIPDEALERLKREVSLTRLIEAQGLKLISQGKDLACRCPWHDGDDTPSCIVSPKTNLWHCFGCDAGGSVIDWVMRRHTVSFRHACELLTKQHPVLAAAPSANAAAPTVKISAGKLRTAQSFSLAAGDQELLDQVIDFYHTTLKASPEALEYLERRGLGNPELIERFRLGYANRTLAYRLAPKQYKAGAEMRTALQRVGILRDSGHEHFNGSIVVPLLSGERSHLAARPVVGAYARKLLDNLRAGTPKHLYLPGPHRGVFNREGLEGQSDIILCEALIDAMTFWSAGYHNVTSCFGVNGMTDELLGALKTCGAQRILIAFDRDEAGDRGAEVLSQRLTVDGLDCYRIQFPKGMDANEYALKVTPATKSLGLVIRKAQWLGQGEAPPRILASNGVPSTSIESEEATKKEIPAPAVIAPAAATVQLPNPTMDTAPAPIAVPLDIVLPASPVPAMASGIEAQVREEEIVIGLGDRRYRVRGLAKNLAFDVLMKVNVLIDRGDAFHVDTLDLYSVRARNGFIAQAARELNVTEDVIRHDLGQCAAQTRRAARADRRRNPATGDETRDAGRGAAGGLGAAPRPAFTRSHPRRLYALRRGR